jgi:hypothetical protein
MAEKKMIFFSAIFFSKNFYHIDVHRLPYHLVA